MVALFQGPKGREVLKTQLLRAKLDAVQSCAPVSHESAPGELETLPTARSFGAQLLPPFLLESVQAVSVQGQLLGHKELR